ncbi:hypothetical protein QP027_04755 [Corynebacterium breve]|uniref:Uncharacterized protein n=1 Tax=Corynebacterium breve TaxID=3049799 RepID=A0ABY8VGD5_9CORY|nr:hypothetical protein [Corynebacterium breve]WIM68700.1 hypothetical protein QP027_04755 [Corynebacterium breve]
MSAPEGRFEVVVVFDVPFARASGFEQCLYSVEGLLVDQWLVVAGIFHAFVGDDAEVVLVGQEALDVVAPQWFSGLGLGWYGQ